MANNARSRNFQRPANGESDPPPMETMGPADDPSGMGMIARGQTLSRVQSSYHQAISVQRPRSIEVVTKRLLEEANLAGESFFYGWGSGDNKIEGGSIGLALAAARCFGNCAVEPRPVEENEQAWFIPVAFIDLETGFTLVRNFRQSKTWKVHGKHDEQRKEDMRFQIGQSKSIRNVVLNALPKWMVAKAIEQAKSGVRLRLEQYIEKHGEAAAQDYAIKQLDRLAVPEAAVLLKFEVANRNGLTVEHLVIIRGDVYALDNGQDRAEELYPAIQDATADAGKKPDGKAAAKQLDKDMDDLMNRETTEGKKEDVKTETTEGTMGKATGEALAKELSAALAGCKTPQEVASVEKVFSDVAATEEDQAMVAGMASECIDRLPQPEKPTEQPKKNGGGGLPGMDEPGSPKGGRKNN